VHDWEVELIAFFFYILYSLKLRAGADNKIYWIHFKRLMCGQIIKDVLSPSTGEVSLKSLQFKVWRMVPLYLEDTEECNVQNFEDCERTVIELKAVMFKSLYIGWLLTIPTSLFFLNF
jgi:hypothetical protein